MTSDLAVRAVDLTRTFKVGETKVEALRGVNLEVPQGRFVALVGPSGSGKSTFLNLVGGLDRPTGGELWIDGVELGASKEKVLTEHRRQRVGFVFQSFNLLPRTSALANVELPLIYAGVSQSRDRCVAALEMVGLGDRLHHKPNELSGGQQQRVAIARALINQPSLLLADEPTGNLDSRTSREVIGLFRKLNEVSGITVILVTHDQDVARHARRVVVLRDGLVVCDTTDFFQVTQALHFVPPEEPEKSN